MLEHPVPHSSSSPATTSRAREAPPRRERDPAEPEDEPGSREPVEDPPELPREPPAEDPLDAPGVGEPGRHDPVPSAPPLGDPPGRPGDPEG